MQQSSGHERLQDESKHIPDQMLPQPLSGAPSAQESVLQIATVEPVLDLSEQKAENTQ